MSLLSLYCDMIVDFHALRPLMSKTFFTKKKKMGNEKSESQIDYVKRRHWIMNVEETFFI